MPIGYDDPRANGLPKENASPNRWKVGIQCMPVGIDSWVETKEGANANEALNFNGLMIQPHESG